jgi:3-hydroxyacyl-CoA dehydrogenase
MSFEIKKAAVLGAGVMGANIAAHLTNAGIECYLLDIIPFELTEDDKKKGLTEKSPAWRNRFAANGLAGATKSKPASFYAKSNASMVTIGNFEDDLSKLADCDWVCEVVVENLKIKQELFAKVEKVIKPTCVVSTNTSGLPIKDISANFSASLKKRFLGTHFFNPPRYMKLMEIIPGKETDKAIVAYMKKFSEEILGKGVVICKDVPNFIGNRIGVYDLCNAQKVMTEKNLKLEDIDAIVGKAVGRPGTAIFGTMDLVGLDIGAHVSKNLYDAVPKDECRSTFLPLDYQTKMMANKWLGNKTKGGFYKKVKDEKGKNVKYALDWKTMEYAVAQRPKFESISAAKKFENVADSMKIAFNGQDAAGDYLREYLCNNFIYSANRIPEICNTIVEIDNAMKWGYNHQLGPFESWDAVGVKEAVEVMKKLGKKVPAKIEEMLKLGCKTFYKVDSKGVKSYYDFKKKGYVKLEENPKIILLPGLKERKKIVKENAAATLVDIGDGVACLEFHTKMNSISGDMIQMISDSCDIVDKDFTGMVVANHDQRMFCAGADIFAVLCAISEKQWADLEKMVAGLQNACMKMKFLPKPVVTAPAGMALGGGCEIAMHGDYCLANGETYMGLVEVGVGVLPAGGGCKELLVRLTEGIPSGCVEQGMNLQYNIGKAFENIATAKVATSAQEAQNLGFIRKTCHINMSRDMQIYEAKQIVLGMSKFYKPPKPALIPVMGENFRGLVEGIIMNMFYGKYISEYDLFVSRKIAYVLSGGDCPEGTFVTEQEILDLEREAFMSLCGQQKTVDRISAMLSTGKPLRN